MALAGGFTYWNVYKQNIHVRTYTIYMNGMEGVLSEVRFTREFIRINEFVGLFVRVYFTFLCVKLFLLV